MSEPTIKSLAERLGSALDSIDWMGRKPRPKLRDAATEEEIAAYEEKVGMTLPPSYKAFLTLHNGMDGADQYDWVVAGVTPVDKGEDFEDARNGHLTLYKKKGADHPAVAALEKSVVVGTDFDYQIAFFEPTTLGDDEPKVRRIAFDMEYDEYPIFVDFREFLEFVVNIYEDLVSMQNMSMSDDLEREEELLKELAMLLDDAGPPKRKPKPTSPPAEPALGSGGGGGGLGGGDADDGLAGLLGAMLAPEPEPEPEPELSPEMQRAANLCALVVEKLMAAELLELVEAPSMRENLEDYLLRKLMRSKGPQDAMESWIYALAKAREVEELYGTDDQLLAVMTKAFEEIS